MGRLDSPLTKRSTGIIGLDAVTRGGLPDAGGVLVLGGPGSGKTVLGLQILAGTIPQGDGGLFIRGIPRADPPGRRLIRVGSNPDRLRCMGAARWPPAGGCDGRGRVRPRRPAGDGRATP